LDDVAISWGCRKKSMIWTDETDMDQ
jgi:hypothetical protein